VGVVAARNHAGYGLRIKIVGGGGGVISWWTRGGKELWSFK